LLYVLSHTMLASMTDSPALARSVDDRRTSCYTLHDEPVVVLCCSCFAEIKVRRPGQSVTQPLLSSFIGVLANDSESSRDEPGAPVRDPVRDIDLTWPADRGHLLESPLGDARAGCEAMSGLCFTFTGTNQGWFDSCHLIIQDESAPM
jgi:hypothetical protein